MKRIATITIAAALVASTAILGSAATAASASSPKLSAKLLSIGQMPIGWSVVSSAGGGGAGCLANVLEPKGIKQTTKASVSFEDNGNVPAVDEALATFTNATTAYRKIEADLMACKHFSGESGGQKITGTVGQMSFPHYGDASVAFAVSLTVQGTAFGEDLLIVRAGSIVMGINEADLVSVDVSQFQGFVKKAVKKLG
jgi:hypothetical protein